MAAASQTATLQKDPVDSARVLSAFQGAIQPVRVNAVYLLGLLVACVTMILLPIVYLGMIAGVAYFTWLWILHMGSIFSAIGTVRDARAMLLIVFIAVAPAVLGVILVLFMLKPLIARRGPKARPRVLNRAAEPFLFSFVEKICKAVGAPVPSEIHVDCDVNASASFRRGIRSMFTNDLVLTIGLPIANGLTMRELAGVLAHEFGHFSQPLAMRLTYFIRSMDGWFARLVYQRDAFDYSLQNLLSEGAKAHWMFGLFALLAVLFIKLTRGILWCLMMCGHIVSCFMLRQMEYDADRYEACLAGADAFEATIRNITVLSVANEMAFNSLGSAWDEGRLADNLPRLIVSNVEKIPKTVHDKLTQRLWTSSTGLFDTHPSNKDRLLAVKTVKSAPVFLVALPATDLFRDFGATARTCSLDFYKVVLGDKVRPENIRPADELIAKDEATGKENKLVCRYLQAPLLPLRPVPFRQTLLKPPEDASAAVVRLKELREKMRQDAPAYRTALKNYDDADTAFLKASMAKLFVAFNCKFKPSDLGVADRQPESANSARQKAKETMLNLNSALIGYENLAAERFTLALQLLLAPDVAAKIPDAAKLAEEAQDFLPMAEFFGGMLPDTIELRNELSELHGLFSNIEGREEDTQFTGRIILACTNINMKLSDFYNKFGNVVYPFDHVKGVKNMREVALSRVPASDKPGQLAAAGDGVVDRLIKTYMRLMGRLGALAEAAELAAGLEPLPELPTEEEEAKRRRREATLASRPPTPAAERPQPVAAGASAASARGTKPKPEGFGF